MISIICCKPAKDFQSWMNVFEKMASFKPKYIIPGHGSASGLSLATNNTYHYLVFLPFIETFA
jgi:hypothetical protein